MADNNITPTGDLFSRVYLSGGDLVSDSKRLRRRIGYYIAEHRGWIGNSVTAIKTELGLSVPLIGSSFNWLGYCEQCETRDFLDSITIWYQSILSSASYNHNAKFFLEFARRSFKEERYSFRIDNAGGVHYLVDEEFQRSRSSLISGLNVPKYFSAQQSLENAFEELTAVHPDTLSAVRSAFDGVENIFKMMTQEARIGKSEIRSTLKPLLEKCGLDVRALNASRLLLDALSEWVNAMHQYRHATDEAEPSPPSMDLAITLVSSAASQARWLAVLDASGAHK